MVDDPQHDESFLIDKWTAAAAVDPRDAVMGLHVADDSPGSNFDVPTDGFFWFHSPDEARNFVAEILPYVDLVNGFDISAGRQALQSDLRALVSEKDIQEIIEAVNRLAAGKWQLLWVGPFDDLKHGSGAWVAEVRERFRDEGQEDDSRPISEGEEQAFIQYLQEWGA